MKKSLPAGISPVMAMLVCRDAAAEIEFCKVTFGASELNVRSGPDGRVTHALLSISGSHVMIEAEWPSLASRAPQDQFWGDRTCRVMNPSAHVWTIATRVEETSAEERTKRWSAIVKTKS